MGWNGALLQDAVNTCTNLSGLIGDCPVFDIQSLADEGACQLETMPQQLVNEAVAGIVGTSLPGDVQIVYGPQTGTQTNPGPPTTVSVSAVGYSPGSTAANSGSVVPGEVFKATPNSNSPTQSTNPTVPSSDAASTSDAPPTTAPDPTAAPTAVATDDDMSVVSTQYVTSGNVVSEIVWKEAVVYVTESEDVTVTMTVQPTSSVQGVTKVRRGHSHDHFRHHLRHGGRR